MAGAEPYACTTARPRRRRSRRARDAFGDVSERGQLRGQESNLHSGGQIPVSYQLDDPAGPPDSSASILPAAGRTSTFHPERTTGGRSADKYLRCNDFLGSA